MSEHIPAPDINNALHRIEYKVDKLDTRLDSVDVTLARQEVHLEEHIRRTRLLEGRQEKFEANMATIGEYVAQGRGIKAMIGWGIGGGSAIAAIASALWQIYKAMTGKP